MKASKSLSSKAAFVEEVATRLNDHLHRMEADSKINLQTKYGGTLYHARAYADRGQVIYVTKAIGTNCGSALDPVKALGWVEWMDAGNNGLIHKYEETCISEKPNYVSIPDSEHRHRFDGIRGRRYKKLEDAFYGLIAMLYPPIPKPVNERTIDFHGYSFAGDGHKKPTYHVMPKDQLKAFESLFSEIREGLDSSFNDGKKDGQDFITQLARGEITIDDFGIKGKPAHRDYAEKLTERERE